jgi:hypothetical protein
MFGGYILVCVSIGSQLIDMDESVHCCANFCANAKLGFIKS